MVMDSSGFLEERKAAMEGFREKNEAIEGKKERESDGKIETFGDLIEEKGRESSSSSDFLSSETTGHEEHSHSSTEESSSPPSTMGWPVQEIVASNCKSPQGSDDGERKNLDNGKLEKKVSVISGIYYAMCMLNTEISYSH